MSTTPFSMISVVARNQGKTYEALLRSKALAAGLTPRRIEIERDLLTDCFRIRGFDREGQRKVMVVPMRELESLDFASEQRLQDEVQYNLKVAQRKMQTDMEREMAAAWNNTGAANYFTTTSTGTTTDTFLWNQQAGLGQQYGQERLGAQRQAFINEFVDYKRQSDISARPKPKNFHEELQRELDSYLKDVLH